MVEQWRLHNRIKFENFFFKLFSYASSYLMMYLAFYVPFVTCSGIGSLLNNNININLLNGRIPIDYIITNDNLSMVSALFAIITFLPFWQVSKYIARYISKIIRHFSSVNELKYFGYIVLIMIFWAFFIGGNIIYILNPEHTWFSTMKISLLICAVLFFSALSNTSTGKKI